MLLKHLEHSDAHVQEHVDNREYYHDVRDTVMKMLAGMLLTPKHDVLSQVGKMYKPEFLRYTYVPEIPGIVEGSILKNLLLGANTFAGANDPLERQSSLRVSNDEAWDVASQCGLRDEFIHAPESFNVGKGGRNLPADVRQAISIARAILSDPDVLMLHKPTTFLTADHTAKVFSVFDSFIKFGGLCGILKNMAKGKTDIGTSTRQMISGHCQCTVMISMGLHDPVPNNVHRTVYVESWPEACTYADHLNESPVYEGFMKKRSQLRRTYQHRYFVLTAGVLSHFQSKEHGQTS